jgi:class 3 adenylate cyclase
MQWLTPAILGVVAFSLFVFTVVFMVLTSKHAHFDLLANIFPPNALKKLGKGKTVVEQYKMATVFFSDIMGYTSMASEMRPISVMDMLNQLYDKMDQLADEHDVYKIETVGDAYMVTGGCPDRCTGPEGAEKVASFALAVIEMVKDFKTADGVQVYIRAGLNSGPIVAGVVGKRRPHYTGET